MIRNTYCTAACHFTSNLLSATAMAQMTPVGLWRH